MFIVTLVKQKHKEKKEKREKCAKLSDTRKIVPIVFHIPHLQTELFITFFFLFWKKKLTDKDAKLIASIHPSQRISFVALRGIY